MRRRSYLGFERRTCCLEVEAVQRTTRVCDVIHPLLGLCRQIEFQIERERTCLLWLRDHHMAVHEYPGDALGYTG